MIRYLVSIIALLGAMSALADDTAVASNSLAKGSRCFELRTYHAAPGKLEALHARFRDFTTKIFIKHNMEMIGFWVPMNKDGQYAARDAAWKDFGADPDWRKVKADSEKNGPLVLKVDSQLMTATDYSTVK
jgi:hypothetical protein